ncbi:MAG: hypothetical protein ABH858_07055, partial [Candidatus Omnitrophota bacterium]
MVAANDEKIVMIEGEAKEVGEDDILQALKQAHTVIKEIIVTQIEMKEKIGKDKKEIPLFKIEGELLNLVKEKVDSRLEGLYGLDKSKKEEFFNSLLMDIKGQSEEGEEITD